MGTDTRKKKHSHRGQAEPSKGQKSETKRREPEAEKKGSAPVQTYAVEFVASGKGQTGTLKGWQEAVRRRQGRQKTTRHPTQKQTTHTNGDTASRSRREEIPEKPASVVSQAGAAAAKSHFPPLPTAPVPTAPVSEDSALAPSSTGLISKASELLPSLQQLVGEKQTWDTIPAKTTANILSVLCAKDFTDEESIKILQCLVELNVRPKVEAAHTVPTINKTIQDFLEAVRIRLEKNEKTPELAAQFIFIYGKLHENTDTSPLNIEVLANFIIEQNKIDSIITMLQGITALSSGISKLTDPRLKQWVETHFFKSVKESFDTREIKEKCYLLGKLHNLSDETLRGHSQTLLNTYLSTITPPESRLSAKELLIIIETVANLDLNTEFVKLKIKKIAAFCDFEKSDLVRFFELLTRLEFLWSETRLSENSLSSDSTKEDEDEDEEQKKHRESSEKEILQTKLLSDIFRNIEAFSPEEFGRMLECFGKMGLKIQHFSEDFKEKFFYIVNKFPLDLDTREAAQVRTYLTHNFEGWLTTVEEVEVEVEVEKAKVHFFKTIKSFDILLKFLDCLVKLKIKFIDLTSDNYMLIKSTIYRLFKVETAIEKKIQLFEILANLELTTLTERQICSNLQLKLNEKKETPLCSLASRLKDQVKENCAKIPSSILAKFIGAYAEIRAGDSATFIRKDVQNRKRKRADDLIRTWLSKEEKTLGSEIINILKGLTINIPLTESVWGETSLTADDFIELIIRIENWINTFTGKEVAEILWRLGTLGFSFEKPTDEEEFRQEFFPFPREKQIKPFLHLSSSLKSELLRKLGEEIETLDTKDSMLSLVGLSKLGVSWSELHEPAQAHLIQKIEKINPERLDIEELVDLLEGFQRLGWDREKLVIVLPKMNFKWVNFSKEFQEKLLTVLERYVVTDKPPELVNKFVDLLGRWGATWEEMPLELEGYYAARFFDSSLKTKNLTAYIEHLTTVATYTQRLSTEQLSQLTDHFLSLLSTLENDFIIYWYPAQNLAVLMIAMTLLSELGYDWSTLNEEDKERLDRLVTYNWSVYQQLRFAQYMAQGGKAFYFTSSDEVDLYINKIDSFFKPRERISDTPSAKEEEFSGSSCESSIEEEKEDEIFDSSTHGVAMRSAISKSSDSLPDEPVIEDTPKEIRRALVESGNDYGWGYPCGINSTEKPKKMPGKIYTNPMFFRPMKSEAFNEADRLGKVAEASCKIFRPSQLRHRG